MKKETQGTWVQGSAMLKIDVKKQLDVRSEWKSLIGSRLHIAPGALPLGS